MSLGNLASNLVLLDQSGLWGDSAYWWIGRLVMFLFFIAMIVLFFWLIRRNAWCDRSPSPMERAQSILAERYARGEIDAEEYRERMGQLS